MSESATAAANIKTAVINASSLGEVLDSSM